MKWLDKLVLKNTSILVIKFIRIQVNQCFDIFIICSIKFIFFSTNVLGFCISVFILSNTAYSQNYSPLLSSSEFNDRVLDVNLSVGTLDGEASTSVGTANYTIPISVPPGTNGVVPQISINYNSTGGRNIVGYGWGISATSSITRTGSSIYFDGETKQLQLNSEDRFVFNGQRLIGKTGVYGGHASTYGKEIEDFSIIYSYGDYGGGPEWFNVVSKSGIIYEYGNSTYSRLQNSNNSIILSWHLSKIIHPDGNYIEFEYYNSWDLREVLLKEIRYTGNDFTGLIPYNKVSFHYGASRVDKNIQYQGGEKIDCYHILENVKVIDENNDLIRKYEFNYAKDEINSYLKEVIEFGLNGSRYNSTIFRYGQQPVSFSTLPTGIGLGQESNYFSGEINGDGYSDYIKLNRYYDPDDNIVYHTSFTVYEKNPNASNTSFMPYQTVDLPDNYIAFQPYEFSNHSNHIADVNGDGLSDVIFSKTTGSGNNRIMDELRIYKSPTTGSIYGAPTIQTPSFWPNVHPSGNYLLVGDFDGNGKTDVLTMLGAIPSNGGAPGPYFTRVFYNNSSWKATDIVGASYFSENQWPSCDNIRILDFNGDGKDDVMLIKDGNCEIMTFENQEDVKRLYFGGFPTAWHQLHLGDFNGDSKTDLLTRTDLSDNNAPWFKALSTGTEFIESPFVFNKTPTINSAYFGDQILISDYNGDGLMDIAHGWNYWNTWGNEYKSKIDLYYSKGIDFHQTQYSFDKPIMEDPQYILNFDSNGDGRAEILNSTGSNNLKDILYFKKEGKEKLLMGIKNGFNHVSGWDYKRMTQTADFYTRGTGFIFWNTIRVQNPMFLVSTFSSQNGIGGDLVHKYSYEEALLHLTGKGFLGFKKIIDKNLDFGTKSIIENEFYNNFITLLPVKKSLLDIDPNFQTSSFEVYIEDLELDFIDLGNLQFWPYLSSKSNKKYTNYTSNGGNLIGTTTTDYVYDDFGNATSTTETIKQGSSLTLETKNTEITYGQYSTPVPAKPELITSTITRLGENPYSTTTKLIYNDESVYYKRGKPRVKIDYFGLSNSITNLYYYSPLGNLSQERAYIDESFRTVYYYYDSKDRFIVEQKNPLSQHAFKSFDAKWGVPLIETSVGGLKKSYEYDDFGRLIKSNYHDVANNVLYSTTNSFNWDIDENLKSIYFTNSIHPGKPDVKIWHDVLDRLIQKKTEGFQDNWITEKTTYDLRANIETVTNPYKAGEDVLLTNSYYDVNNRIVNQGNSVYGYTTFEYENNLDGFKTTITGPDNQIKSSIIDLTGRIIKITDFGGTVNKSYFSHGGLKEVMNGNQSILSLEYDEYGRKTKLIDVNAGITEYEFDSNNQLISQTNANNQTQEFYYNSLRNIDLNETSEGNINYEYYPSGSGSSTNKIKKITNYNGVIDEYVYDDLGRIQSKVKTIDGISYTNTYLYNVYNDLININYHSGLGIKYEYDPNGYLMNIKNQEETISLFENTGMNGYNHYTSYLLGNNKSTIQNFFYGMPTYTSTSDNVQQMHLNWNYQTGNLSQRFDVKQGKIENFDYDNLNRLTEVSIVEGATTTITYSQNGNISSKSDVGSYLYETDKVNANTFIEEATTSIPLLTQDVSYNSFLQPINISEGNYSMGFTYDSNHERVKFSETLNDNHISSRYYLDGYEINDLEGESPIFIHYISVGNKNIAIVKRVDNVDTYNYTYTDHLGSILTVTDDTGSIIGEQSFDAWGRKRNPVDWLYTSIPDVPTWLYRGYTGHEHYSNYNLINMNGRMYDPIVGRMLSTDNFTHGGTQGYNRYSYTLNNPLKYTDPDGEHPLLVAAAVGGTLNWFAQAMMGNVNSTQDGLIAFGTGALMGGLGAIGSTTYASAGLSAVASVGSSYLPSYQMNLGNDFSFGISPSVFFGSSGWGLGVDFQSSVEFGDFTFGASIRSNYGYNNVNHYKGWTNTMGGGGAYDTDNFHFSLGFTGYSEGGGIPTQGTGLFGIGGKKWKLQLGNDIISGTDAYRTAAANLSIGEFSAGFNLYTGDAGPKRSEEDSFTMIDGNDVYRSNNGYNPDEFRLGAAFVGYKNYKFGWNSETIRHRIQNEFAHDFIMRGKSKYFRVLPDKFPGGIYGGLFTKNPYTLWAW